MIMVKKYIKKIFSVMRINHTKNILEDKMDELRNIFIISTKISENSSKLCWHSTFYWFSLRAVKKGPLNGCVCVCDFPYHRLSKDAKIFTGSRFCAQGFVDFSNVLIWGTQSTDPTLKYHSFLINPWTINWLLRKEYPKLYLCQHLNARIIEN